MIVLPWVLFGICVLMLFCSLYYNWKFANLILKMEDEISQSLDILDARYLSMSKVLEIPIFFDSPQVRQVIDDIRDSRDSVLLIANKLANVEEVSDGQDQKNN